MAKIDLEFEIRGSGILAVDRSKKKQKKQSRKVGYFATLPLYDKLNKKVDFICLPTFILLLLLLTSWSAEQ